LLDLRDNTAEAYDCKNRDWEGTSKHNWLVS